jgi:Protein of unknown function (DUF3768)
VLTAQQHEATARLNDAWRSAIDDESGFFSSAGFNQLSLGDQSAVCALVKSYDVWRIDDDVDGYRDFGVIFKLADGRWTTATPNGAGWLGAVFWRIICFEGASCEPALAPWDATTTRRALTLMLPEEY